MGARGPKRVHFIHCTGSGFREYGSGAVEKLNIMKISDIFHKPSSFSVSGPFLITDDQKTSTYKITPSLVICRQSLRNIRVVENGNASREAIDSE